MRAQYRNLDVLVVDDVAPVRIMLQGILSALGIARVGMAESAAAAIDLLRLSVPDVVITDWSMPNGDGLTLTRWVRAHPQSPNPFLPILMVTGMRAETQVKAARDAGVDAFLAKPVSPKSVADRLAMLVERPRSYIAVENYLGPDRRRPATHARFDLPGEKRTGRPVDPRFGLIVPPLKLLHAKARNDREALEKELALLRAHVHSIRQIQRNGIDFQIGELVTMVSERTAGLFDSDLLALDVGNHLIEIAKRAAVVGHTGIARVARGFAEQLAGDIGTLDDSHLFQLYVTAMRDLLMVSGPEAEARILARLPPIGQRAAASS